MADRNFRVKSGLIVSALSTAGIVKTDSSGVISSSSIVGVSEGGTGQTTANNALNALLPIQNGGTVNYTIQSDGTNVSWAKVYNQLIQNGGVSVTPRRIINFVGATLSDDSGSDTTTITFTDNVGVSKSGGDTITASSASVKPLIIKGAASQTANLQEWQDSGSNVWAHVGLSGSRFGAIGSQGATFIDQYGNLTVRSNSTVFGNSIVSVGTAGASSTGITIRSVASQTANLQEWQDSTGLVLSKVDSAGRWYGTDGLFSLGVAVGATGSPGPNLYVKSRFASQVAAAIRGVASQTANLQEWQDSAGTVLANVDSSGVFILRGFNSGYHFINIGGNTVNSALINISPTSNIVPLLIRGVSGQSSNLQEWQNSAGTVLASINASGNLMVQDLTVNGTTTTINSTTLTVDDKNIELASVASPTDTTADGAGITIKGATDKTFNWVQSTAAFTSSEPISAPAFKSAGTAVSSNITLVSGYKYFVDTTSARTLTLPASPSLGDEIVIFDASGTVFTNNITVARNGNKINGISDNAIIDINGSRATLTYTGSTYGWRFE